MLTLENKPDCMKDYALVGFTLEQRLGEAGLLVLNLHTAKSSKQPDLQLYSNLQDVLGQDINCKFEDWSFAGTVEQLEYSGEKDVYYVTLRDPLSKLKQIYCSQVFADQTLEDIVSHLIPPGVDYECISGCGSDQIKLAIQYQESNFDFLRKIVNDLGGQIWCYAKKIYIGMKPMDNNSATLRLGRDITDYSIRSQLGPESIEVDSISYLEGCSQSSSIELQAKNHGEVQDSCVDLRKRKEGQKTFHLIHEDASYDDTTHMAHHFLRSKASGRFMLEGVLHKAVPLGAEIKIESFEKGGAKEKLVETTIAKNISASENYLADECHWEIELTSPQAMLDDMPVAASRVVTSAAIVTDANDPQCLNRVKVYFPWDRNECETPWIRMASPSWGENHYQFIPPKPNDTVLVIWGQKDMDPVILGCLSGGDSVEQKSELVVLQTVEGHTITIGDKGIKLNNEADGGASSVEVQPDKIVVTAQQGQKITIGKNSIIIDSGGGDSVEVKLGQIKFTSSGNIELIGATGIKLSAPKVDIG